MCIIACSETGIIPSMETLKQCRQRNRDGIGIAWLGKDGVEFRRGIGLDKAWKCLRQIERDKVPYVLHFRFATQGSAKDLSLTHPFPVSTKARELRSLRGRTDRVFAHNGTWSAWRGDELAAECGFKQTGSDSMFMAFLVAKGYHFNETDLKWYHRLAHLSMKDGLVRQGNWSLDAETGIHYSNGGYKVYKATTMATGGRSTYGYPYFDGYGFDDDDDSVATVSRTEKWLNENGYWQWEKGIRVWHSYDGKRKATEVTKPKTDTVSVVHSSACVCYECCEKRKVVAKADSILKADDAGLTHQCFGEYCDVCHPPERPAADGDVCQIAEADKSPAAKADQKAWRRSSWCMTPKPIHEHCGWSECECGCHQKFATPVTVRTQWISPWCGGGRGSINHNYCSHWKCDCHCHAAKHKPAVSATVKPYLSIGCTAGNHEGCACPSQCDCICKHPKYKASEKTRALAQRVISAAERALRDEKKSKAIVLVKDGVPRNSFMDGAGRDGKSVAIILPSFGMLCEAVAFIARGSKSETPLVHTTLCECPVRDGEIWHKIECVQKQPHVGWMERTFNMLTGKENEGGK